MREDENTGREDASFSKDDVSVVLEEEERGWLKKEEEKNETENHLSLIHI